MKRSLGSRPDIPPGKCYGKVGTARPDLLTERDIQCQLTAFPTSPHTIPPGPHAAHLRGDAGRPIARRRGIHGATKGVGLSSDEAESQSPACGDGGRTANAVAPTARTSSKVPPSRANPDMPRRTARKYVASASVSVAAGRSPSRTP